MRDFEGLFDEFASQLNFPDYFGRNFNALDDCLNDLAWLPADGYLVVVTEGLSVLADETDDDVAALIQLLDRAGAEWSRPVHLGEQWDRDAKPFHVVFQASSQDATRLEDRIRLGGRPVSDLSHVIGS